MASALVEAALEAVPSGAGMSPAKEAVKHATAKDRRLKRAIYHLGLKLIVNHLNERYAQEHQL